MPKSIEREQQSRLSSKDEKSSLRKDEISNARNRISDSDSNSSSGSSSSSSSGSCSSSSDEENEHINSKKTIRSKDVSKSSPGSSRDVNATMIKQEPTSPSLRERRAEKSVGTSRRNEEAAPVMREKGKRRDDSNVHSDGKRSTYSHGESHSHRGEHKSYRDRSVEDRHDTAPRSNKQSHSNDRHHPSDAKDSRTRDSSRHRHDRDDTELVSSRERPHYQDRDSRAPSSYRNRDEDRELRTSDKRRKYDDEESPPQKRRDDRHKQDKESPPQRRHNDRHRRDEESPPRKRHDDRLRRDEGRSDDNYANSRNRQMERKKRKMLEKEEDISGYQFGAKQEEAAENDEAVEKEEPNFELSGKLTEFTNTYKGVVIMYNEPPEARKPKTRWRLYPFKGEESLPVMYVHRQSAYLIGRDRKIADIPVDHPSCSKQHAALQFRLVNHDRDDGAISRKVKPYVIDLDAPNGTYLNNQRIDARRYYELKEQDVLKFGFSSREYVILHEKSQDDPSSEEEEEKEAES